MTAAASSRAGVPAPARSRRPEAWLYGVAGAGWLSLVLLSGGGHHPTGSAGAHAAGWVAMVAVMAPLIAPNVRYAAARSPGRARGSVAAAVTSGWALVWAGGVVVLAVGTEALLQVAGRPAALGTAAGAAVAWQWTALKRRSLARCDRRLAPPLDRLRARRAARRFGAGLGRDCVLSCWPLMALMGVAGHSVPVTAACVALAWYERRGRPHHDPAARETSLVIAGIGVGALVVGLP